ncbi:MAG: putative transposase, partial [Halioglobus sp.]
QDVAAYMRYYNQERFHSSNVDMSPVYFENSQIKVSCLD